MPVEEVWVYFRERIFESVIRIRVRGGWFRFKGVLLRRRITGGDSAIPSASPLDFGMTAGDKI
jgi:hypothetical protein